MLMLHKKLTAIVFLLLTLATITFNGTIKGLLTKTVTLSVSSSITGISSFSFDIAITGSG